MYKIIAIMGKAGAGKDTLLQHICKINPEWNEIVSCTTRPPREGEVDTVNYFFLTQDEFLDRMYDGRMLEVTNFRGWSYGTSIDGLKENTINVGVFNPAGIDKITSLKDIVDPYVILVTCDDKTRLLRQLNREEHPDVQEIIRRFGTDEEDFQDVIKDFSPRIVENQKDTNMDILAQQIVQDLVDWEKDKTR